jgi:hypothetical protein
MEGPKPTGKEYLSGLVAGKAADECNLDWVKEWQ